MIHRSKDSTVSTGRTMPMSFAKGVFDTFDPSTPHLGTIVIGGGDSDDRLQWNEVCWAASFNGWQAARETVSGARNYPG
jgi:hypothetical protein